MKKGYEKYRGFEPINIPDRTWPDKTITKAPSGARLTFVTATKRLLTR